MATLPMSTPNAEEAVGSYLKTIQAAGPIYELVRGRIVPVPKAHPQHDRLQQQLAAALTTLCQTERPNAIVCTTPHLIRTGLSSLRLPSLSLLDRPADPATGSVPLLDTTPALTIEIVAPGRSREAYRAKRSEYAALGISEYWIVDPEARKVSVLLWSDGFYDCTEYSGKTDIASPRFPLRFLTVESLFAIR